MIHTSFWSNHIQYIYKRGLKSEIRMRNFSGADSLAARIPVSSLQSAKEAAHLVNICLFAGIIQAEDDNVAR